MILTLDGGPYCGPIGPKSAREMFDWSQSAATVDLNKIPLNSITYFNYLYDMLNIYMSVFEWKNLPRGCDERMLEYWLMLKGFVGFVYDRTLEHVSKKAPYGYAIMKLVFQGAPDIYNLPDDYRAYSVKTGANDIPCDSDNSVIIFNNELRVTPMPHIEMLAKRLANIERTTDVNVQNQKTPKIIKCNEKQRLSYENMMNQVAENQAYVWASDKMALDTVEVLDTTAPYIADKNQTLKHQYWNEFLTFAGVENTNTEKKERRVTDEVMANMGDVEAHRFVRLNPRKRAADEINELLDAKGWFDEVDPDTGKERLPVDVEYRSGVYIRTDKDGSIPTTGMQTGEDDTTGYDSSGGPSVNGFMNAMRQFFMRGGYEDE